MDEEEEQKRKHRNERRRQLYAEKKLTMQLQQQNMAGLRDDDKGKSSASLVLDQQRSHRNERRRQLYKERKEELNKTSQPRKKRRISCLAAVSEAAQEDGSNLDELHSGLPDDDKGKNSAALVRDQRRSHRNKRRRQLYNERKEEFNSAEGESSSRINKTSQPRKKRRISCLAAVSEVAQEDGYSLDALHSGFDCAVAAAPSTSKGIRSTRRNKGRLPRYLTIPRQASILPPQQACRRCGAVKFYLETASFCCMKGQVSLYSRNCPTELQELFLSSSEEAKQFRTYVRTYNSSFAFTSFGVKYDKNLCQRTSGVYTFKIQGQVYHFVHEFHSVNDKLSPLQLYFYDTDHEADNRLKLSKEKLNKSVLNKLINILRFNPYSAFFRSLGDVNDLDTHQIMLRSDTGVDQRVYNCPSVSQVAAIWTETEGETTERDILVQRISGHSEKVQCHFGCYDPLQYPLLFPFGETGWHHGI